MDVGFDDLHARQEHQVLRVARAARCHRHGHALLRQARHQVAADKTGTAEYDDFHITHKFLLLF